MNDRNKGVEPPLADGEPPLADLPRYRPSDQFWPYADLPQRLSEEEIATLDPDLVAALEPEAPARPFSITVVFAPFDTPDYERALAIAQGASHHWQTVDDAGRRHRVRFRPSEAVQLRDLWRIVGHFDSSDVLVDDRPVPYARELWLPLVWFLIPR